MSDNIKESVTEARAGLPDSYLKMEQRQPTRNGWAVLTSSDDGHSKSVGRPHLSQAGAVIERGLKILAGYRPANVTVVDHDEEMRRWDYTMGIIEPTDQERATLPLWHRNYRPAERSE